ncbi:MAG: AbrB/MazE/SpoVT family DNA-binding domain-containing protein [Candidatus Helarchaeota archaeon]
MFDKPEFFGSTTVGDRGQIVLPAELRKKYRIKTGDKLLVIGMSKEEHYEFGRVLLFKTEGLSKFLVNMENHQKIIKEILSKSEKEESK